MRLSFNSSMALPNPGWCHWDGQGLNRRDTPWLQASLGGRIPGGRSHSQGIELPTGRQETWLQDPALGKVLPLLGLSSHISKLPKREIELDALKPTLVLPSLVLVRPCS